MKFNDFITIYLKKELTGSPSLDKPHEKSATFFEKHPIIPNISIYHGAKLITKPFRLENSINCYDVTLTYEELFQQAIVLSKAMKELGIKKGDVVSISMPNFIQSVSLFLAANRIGAITTFINPNTPFHELKQLLNAMECPLFINYKKNQAFNEEIKKNTKVQNIITLNKQHQLCSQFSTVKKEKIGYSSFISYQDMGIIAEFYKQHIYSLYGKKEDALILFTSGSTGEPKGVVLSNENVIASALYMKNSTHLPNIRGEKTLACVPFSYPYGFITSTLMSLLSGREVILAPNLSYKNITYYVKKQPNMIFGSPAVIELILRNISEDIKLSSLHTIISGGDFALPKKISDWKAKFQKYGANVRICNGFGNAELTGAATNSMQQNPRIGTVGKPFVGTDILILNEQGYECTYNEPGNIYFSGKHLFDHYMQLYPETNAQKQTEKTKIIYKNKKYLDTGALGSIDKDGYLTIIGRKSRFYIPSSTNKIYCDNVQSIISALPIIKDCVVVPKPNDELLFVGKAYIVLQPNVLPTEKTMASILEQLKHPISVPETNKIVQLKEEEIPTSITFLDEIPLTKADKIDFKTLEKMAEEEYQQELGKTYIKK